MPFCTLQNVLISEPVHHSCSDILKENGINVTQQSGLSEEQLIQEIKKYDGLVVRSATKVTKKIIDAADNLKVIGRAGTGVDNIDCDAATVRGILVLNAPGGNALSAAELTCGMIVSLSRNIPEACASLKSGKWDRKSFMGNELNGKTLGIIGLGRIGREVAIRMQSFGMKTIGFDPLVPADVSKDFGVESFELKDMWPLCDYITVHTPLIRQTKNLINAEVLSVCKKGVKIVNCARGGIVDEEALLQSLEAGHCGGAGFDVFLEEPPKCTALLEHPKMICTPHLGASTHDAQIRVAKEIAEQFVDLGKGNYIAGIVNCQKLSNSFDESNRHWVALTIAVGKLMGNLFEKGSQISANLTVYGRRLEEKRDILSASSLVGLLEGQSKKGPNLVNAPTIAKEAGIEVSNEFQCEPPAESAKFYSSLMLTASSPTSGASHSLIATLQNDSAFLCAIDGCGFCPPVQLSGKLIFCHGISEGNMFIKAITYLTSQGRVSTTFISTPFDGKVWYVFKVDADISELPEKLTNVIDFWAQIDF